MAVHGGSAIRRRLRVIVRNVRAEVAEQLDQAAEDLLLRARQLAPQLSGELIDAGDIAGRQTRDVVSRTIFFDSLYAVVRHENVYNLGPISSVKSSPDGPIGRKFLQRPFETHRERYQRDIVHGLRRALLQSLR